MSDASSRVCIVDLTRHCHREGLLHYFQTIFGNVPLSQGDCVITPTSPLINREAATSEEGSSFAVCLLIIADGSDKAVNLG